MTRTTIRSGLALVAALVLTAIIYAPGIGGDFIYDDLPFIVNNPGIHGAHASFDAWMRAAFSFPSAHQGRWIGMLSFALNDAVSGLNVAAFKLTNLLIHLLNGLLLYAMLRRLFALAAHGRNDDANALAQSQWLAVGITAAWLILPINLTAVLYVSQRLESLCGCFVLIGLAGYFSARLRRLQEGRPAWPMALWLIVATAAGCTVKESAVLLPLYALIADAVLTGLRKQDGRIDRSIAVLYAAILGVPAIAGTAWLLHWIFGPTAYSMNVSGVQRLLTEARVLVDYLQWTLWPRLDQLALIHDDYLPSQGLLAPLSTALSMLLLAGLVGIAWVVRRRVPLASIGILWFFAGHLLTGTIIPLLLVFEHRNYFPSIGVLLTVAATLAALPRKSLLRMLASAVAILLMVNAVQVTARRAIDWGDGWRFALTEATHRPQSSDAQYALAVAMSRGAGGNKVSQDLIEAVLAHAARLPYSSIAPEATLIIGRAEAGRAVDPAWWRSLIAKLQSRPPSSTDINALGGLLQCHLERPCKDMQSLFDAYSAALSQGAPSGQLLANYAAFALQAMHDPVVAERALRDALVARPGDASYRASLIQLLRVQNRIPEAQAEMAKLRAANHFGKDDAIIAALDAADGKHLPRN
ncbi:MAG: hypothetical protein ABI365_01005 [Lysobacteraceae bacterium]